MSSYLGFLCIHATRCIWNLISGVGGVDYFSEMSKMLMADETCWEVDDAVEILSKRQPLIPQDATAMKDLVNFFKYTPLRSKRWEDLATEYPRDSFFQDILRDLATPIKGQD